MNQSIIFNVYIFPPSQGLGPKFNLTRVWGQAWDGTIIFSNNINEWPRDGSGLSRVLSLIMDDDWHLLTGDVFECLHFYYIDNVTFSSAGVGTLDGQGELWWGLPGIGYLVREENRYWIPTRTETNLWIDTFISFSRFRPRLFRITDSKNILVENYYFLNSPYW